MPAEEQPPQQQPLDVNLDLVGLDAPSSISEDRQSRKEEQLFGDRRRREELRETVHVALVIALRVAVILFVVVFAARVLDAILPENNATNAGKWMPHAWLTDNQVGAIDKFAFGALGAVVAQLIRNLISKDR